MKEFKMIKKNPMNNSDIAKGKKTATIKIFNKIYLNLIFYHSLMSRK